MDGRLERERGQRGRGRRTTSKEDREWVQVGSGATGGDEGLLDNLVGNKVSSRSRTITQQGSTGSTEDRGKTALLVQGTGNIDGSVVELGGTRALGLYSL